MTSFTNGIRQKKSVFDKITQIYLIMVIHLVNYDLKPLMFIH